VTLWAGWHVLESVPPEVNELTITVSVTDDAGRVGSDQIRVQVDHGRDSAQALTPAPATFTAAACPAGATPPEVSMIAPRVPTALTIGPTESLTAANGSLFFIQVSALDRSGAGIAIDELGLTDTNPMFPAGLIIDPGQIPNPTTGAPGGPNRNVPGLLLTFDVPLRQASGNVVPAGVNLAPLFDVAGSEVDAPGGPTRTIADWVVGGSLEVPAGQDTVTITAAVTDNAGCTGTATSVLGISQVVSGQTLSPAP
jgi:hypothetical protein